MNKIVLILITSLLFVSSCKDDEETEPVWDPSGLYNVKVQVNRRPPCLSEGNDNPSYKHEKMFGHIFDTTQNTCCRWALSVLDCPDSYTLFNVRIFKTDNHYFLYNGIDYFEGEQISFHIPLSLRENTLFVNPDLSEANRGFHVGSHQSTMYTSIERGWLIRIELLKLEITKEENKLSGTWVWREKTDACPTTVSNGESKEFTTSEFADITFTKIGD